MLFSCPLFLVLMVLNSLLPSFISLFFQFLFLDNDNILNFKLNTPHFDYIIFLKKEISRVVINSLVFYHIIHSFSHLIWRKEWVTSFLILIINIKVWPFRFNSTNIILIPNFANSHQLLLISFKLYLSSIQILKNELMVLPDNFL